jgi:hypothetical protein
VLFAVRYACATCCDAPIDLLKDSRLLNLVARQRPYHPKWPRIDDLRLRACCIFLPNHNNVLPAADCRLIPGTNCLSEFADLKCHASRTFYLVGSRCTAVSVSGSLAVVRPNTAKTSGKAATRMREQFGTALALSPRVSGRRSHPRFLLSNCDGVLSMLREVSVRQTPTGELVVVDRESRQVGDVLTLETLVNGTPISTRVHVIASSPIVRGGTVLHELRLMPLNETPATGKLDD